MGSLRNYLRAWNRLNKASRLKMGISFRDLVCKRVWKTFFGLKKSQDLNNRAAHPHQEFLVVSPFRGSGAGFKIMLDDSFRLLFTYRSVIPPT